MKNLRLYETEALYTSDPIEREYPTVSYCKETDTVHFEKKQSYFIGTYNATSTTEGIQLLWSSFDLSQIKEMYIDNVKQETVVATYTFATTGTHIVKCVMKDDVTTMYGMFYECSGLTTLDVSNFNTSSVTDMSWMFCRCVGLTSLNLSNFNTSNVTIMYNMFLGCSGLTSLDVSNFDTSNVTLMQSMFDGCNNLTSIDLSSFNTSKVTVMASMFSKCSSLTSLDLSNFNTSKVTNMSDMFEGCMSLTSLDVSNFNTSNVTNMNWMFGNCIGLTSIDLRCFDTSKVTEMYSMFGHSRNLTSIIFGLQADVSKVTSYTGCTDMFANITTTGTLYYPLAYETSWNNIIVTKKRYSQYPSTWTAIAVDYENQE